MLYLSWLQILQMYLNFPKQYEFMVVDVDQFISFCFLLFWVVQFIALDV